MGPFFPCCCQKPTSPCCPALSTDGTLNLANAGYAFDGSFLPATLVWHPDSSCWFGCVMTYDYLFQIDASCNGTVDSPAQTAWYYRLRCQTSGVGGYRLDEAKRRCVGSVPLRYAVDTCGNPINTIWSSNTTGTLTANYAGSTLSPSGFTNSCSPLFVAFGGGRTITRSS